MFLNDTLFYFFPTLHLDIEVLDSSWLASDNDEDNKKIRMKEKAPFIFSTIARDRCRQTYSAPHIWCPALIFEQRKIFIAPFSTFQ